jgi:hypothetical protein
VTTVPEANVPLLDSISHTLPPKSVTATPTRPLLDTPIAGKPDTLSAKIVAGAIAVHAPYCQPTGHVNTWPGAARYAVRNAATPS